LLSFISSPKRIAKWIRILWLFSISILLRDELTLMLSTLTVEVRSERAAPTLLSHKFNEELNVAIEGRVGGIGGPRPDESGFGVAHIPRM
jgi:hypothetical protein